MTLIWGSSAPLFETIKLLNEQVGRESRRADSAEATMKAFVEENMKLQARLNEIEHEKPQNCARCRLPTGKDGRQGYCLEPECPNADMVGIEPIRLPYTT